MMTTHSEAFRAEAVRLLFAARSLMKRYGRETLKEADDIDGKRMTIGGRDVPAGVDTDADLPKVMKGRKSQKAQRRVYRILKRLRAHPSGHIEEITAARILDEWRVSYPNSEASLKTIKNALTYLRKKRLAHPSRDGRGWVLGTEQGVLFSGADSAEAPGPLTVAHTERVAHDSRARFVREYPMEPNYIWVPVEDGQVADATTDTVYPVAGELGELNYREKTGRGRKRLAYRGELMSVNQESRLAQVRIKSGTRHYTIHTAILGDWHLKGELAPPEAVRAG